MDTHAQIVATPDGGQVCFGGEWGVADGVPVFSMHGTPGCRLLGAKRIELGFETLLAELGIRLITYDRPGYGRSDRQPGRSVAPTTDHVSAIADKLRIDRFAVVGDSSGSAHALAVAALLAGRVVRVACTAPMDLLTSSVPKNGHATRATACGSTSRHASKVRSARQK
jgi:pimeloyl-ACP methyl ester carboxylesterase